MREKEVAEKRDCIHQFFLSSAVMTHTDLNLVSFVGWFQSLLVLKTMGYWFNFVAWVSRAPFLPHTFLTMLLEVTAGHLLTAARFDQRSKMMAIRSMFAVWRLILQRRDASSQQRRVFFPVT